MGFLLFASLCLIFLEIKLIINQYSYIQKLVGVRFTLKEENERLRKENADLKREVENVVLKITTD